MKVKIRKMLFEALKKKSPQDFAEWTGCSIDDAIKIFSEIVAIAKIISPNEKASPVQPCSFANCRHYVLADPSFFTTEKAGGSIPQLPTAWSRCQLCQYWNKLDLYEPKDNPKEGV